MTSRYFHGLWLFWPKEWDGNDATSFFISLLNFHTDILFKVYLSNHISNSLPYVYIFPVIFPISLFIYPLFSFTFLRKNVTQNDDNLSLRVRILKDNMMLFSQVYLRKYTLVVKTVSFLSGKVLYVHVVK